jgi:hypothetical protein
MNISMDDADALCGKCKNFETWLGVLYTNEDEYLNRLLMEACRLTATDVQKAEWLEKLMREALSDNVTRGNFWDDLLATAFARIDWVQVIENKQ